MKTKNIFWLTSVALVAAGWAPLANAGHCLGGSGKCAAGRTPAQAAGAAGSVEPAWGDGSAVVAPIDSTPAGQTYGRWAAQWWQWAIGVPAAVNPIFDVTGEQCAQRQVGQVWFLAGVGGDGTVTRSCKIPAGKALFFPLINHSYGAFLNDEPPETRTEAYVRDLGNCTEPAQIAAWIDGNKVQRPTRYFTGPSGSPSTFFNIQMPPHNIIGNRDVVPELLLSPSAEQGYYLFVRPLRPGKHTLRWIATGCSEEGFQDITYNLTVEDR